jgi:hypothetical protein
MTLKNKNIQMKSFFLILAFLLILVGCRKEEVSELQSRYFIKFYGSYLEDMAYDLEESTDGGIVFVGTVERESTGKDIALYKVDEYGNQADWSPKFFGSAGDDIAYSIKILDNEYVIAGSVSDNDGNKNAYIIRTNTQGNIIGQEYFYETEDDDYAVSIESREDGGFVVVGYSEDPVSLSRNFFVISLNADLSNPRITASQSNQEDLQKVIFNREDEYIAMGNQYINSGSDTQLFLARLNETGNIFDLAFIGSPNLLEVLSDAVSPNESTLYLLGTVKESANSAGNIFLKKVVNLREEWSRTISDSGDLEGKAIGLKANGDIVIAADKSFGDDKNIILYLLDSEGNIEGSREYGGTGNQLAEDVLVTDQNLVILGRNIHQGNSMITLIKTDENGNIWE